MDEVEIVGLKLSTVPVFIGFKNPEPAVFIYLTTSFPTSAQKGKRGLGFHQKLQLNYKCVNFFLNKYLITLDNFFFLSLSNKISIPDKVYIVAITKPQ